MDARRRRRTAWVSLALGLILLGSAVIALAPRAWAGPIRPGEEPIEAITVTTRTRASWYGTGFHGKVTANGRVFNQTARTAAHRTLPFGTRVEVTNLRNGRKLTVVVNDRGPFVPGRGIDVSAGVASKLGFRHRGVATVRMAIRIPMSRGLALIGPSLQYTLWVPPRRGSLSASPVLLETSVRSDRIAPATSVAHRAMATSDQDLIWQ